MLGITDYGAFVATVLVFLMIPGPGTFCLLASLGQGGVRAGLSTAAGLILGDQVLMWLAVFGVAAILQSHPAWLSALRWVGAVYLAWIGLQLLFRKTADVATTTDDAVPRRDVRALRRGFLVTLTNPKAILFYMAFFPLFIDPSRHRGLITFAAMALTIMVISAAYCVVLCFSAQAIAARLRRVRGAARTLERLAGVTLIGFGLKLGIQ